jgi:O-antigen ligase
MIAAKPILGFGWDTGNDHINDYFRVNPNIPFTGAHAGFHNIYLLYGVGLGLVGLGLWLVAIGSAFAFALLRGARAGPLRAAAAWGTPWPRTEIAWRTGFGAIVVAWAVIGLTAPADYIFSTLLLWVWCGAVWGADRSQLPVGAATTWRWSQGNPASNALG